MPFLKLRLKTWVTHWLFYHTTSLHFLCLLIATLKWGSRLILLEPNPPRRHRKFVTIAKFRNHGESIAIFGTIPNQRNHFDISEALWSSEYFYEWRAIRAFITTLHLFSIASYTGVIILALDRFLAIHLHLRYRELVTQGRLLAVVIFNWVSAVLLAFLRFMNLEDIGRGVNAFLIPYPVTSLRQSCTARYTQPPCVMRTKFMLCKQTRRGRAAR